MKAKGKALLIGSNRLDSLGEDSRWDHISHCSPYYGEFLRTRNRFLEIQANAQKRKRKFFIISMLAAVGLMAWIGVMFLKGR